MMERGGEVEERDEREGGWREACWRLVGDWMEALGMGETPYWNNNTLSSHTFLRKLRSTINNARMYV